MWSAVCLNPEHQADFVSVGLCNFQLFQCNIKAILESIRFILIVYIFAKTLFLYFYNNISLDLVFFAMPD